MVENYMRNLLNNIKEKCQNASGKNQIYFHGVKRDQFIQSTAVCLVTREKLDWSGDFMLFLSLCTFQQKGGSNVISNLATTHY